MELELSRNKRHENTLLAIAGALVGLGIVMVYSSSAFRSQSFAESAFKVWRQIVWAALSVTGMFFTMYFDYRRLARLSPWLMGFSALLLALVLVPGVSREINGARRWLQVGSFNFQPSELAKFSVILFTAWYADRYRDRLKQFWRGLLPAALAVGTVAGLVVVEPDLGTCMYIMTVAFIMLLVAGIRPLHLLPLGALAAPALAYLVLTKFSHVQARLAAFFNPGSDGAGVGYQVKQSLIALGSGGLFGLGLGQSNQKLYFLPARDTDFIFSIIGEELGFMGSCVVIILFMGLLVKGIQVARRSRDLLGFMLAFGVVFAVSLQALLNLAVVTGSVPPKGISLPFISFGGSGLFFLMLSVGVVVNVARVNRGEVEEEIEKDKIISLEEARKRADEE